MVEEAIKIAYATNAEWAEKSGLGIRRVDENVGTGDNSETDFDLDFTNIISGSYTLSHAPASGATNTFTALTETTHYTLDKDSGRVVLTAGGVTEVGTDVIYATYYYTELFSDSMVTSLITAADDEIDKRTGRLWDTPVAVVEYRDGIRRSQYPTTDAPYAVDLERPDFIVANKQPITEVTNIYFLNPPQAVSKCFNYDLGTTTFTDKTDEVNSTTEAPFTLFDDSPATGDILYIGSAHQFLGLKTVLSTAGVDSGSTAIDWEYWNGSAWTDLSETDTNSGASIFTTSGEFTWTYPYGWAKNSVNGESAYWIRGTLTDDYSTDPIVATFTLKDSVASVLEPRQINWKDSTIRFENVAERHGSLNIRMDYKYGHTTTPTYIKDLSIYLAALNAYITLSGGSYDDATSYTLGSKAVTIGEVYVNIREVIAQFQKRIDKIYELIGKRSHVIAI